MKIQDRLACGGAGADVAALLLLLIAMAVFPVFIAGCAAERVAQKMDGSASSPIAHMPPNVHHVQTHEEMFSSREIHAEEDFRKFDQPDEAANFFLQQRLAPGASELPLEHLVAEAKKLRERQAQRAALRGASSSGDIDQWQELGPGNIGGRTRTIVIDPTAPDTMYAAGVNGGIWKSFDAGATWTPLDDFLPNLAVSALTMDPTNTNILYAGTGEGVFPGTSSPRGMGIFKSVDAGATWNLLDGTVNVTPANAFQYVHKVVISPNDSDRIYAGTRTGVWRSLDGGVSWSVVLSNPRFIGGFPSTNGCDVGCIDLVLRSDSNPDILFAAFGSFENDGLYRSLDGGDTWVEFVTGTNQGRMSLAIAPSNNDVIYISMADNGTGGAVGQLVNIFRSIDGGDTYEGRVDFQSLVGPWLLSNLALATGCIPAPVYSQGWHDNAIAVDPVDPDSVWVGGIDLFRSDDGGQTFGITGYWFADQTSLIPNEKYLHADQHFVVFHPDYDGVANQTMYVGDDGGVFRTPNARAATSQEDCPHVGAGALPAIEWIDVNNGYGVTQFYHGDSAKETSAFAGGTQDNGTNQVLAVGAPNSWSRIFGGDGGYVAIDPFNAQTMYVEIQFFPEIRKSIDGGLTFTLAVDGITDTDGLFITPFAMDQNDPQVLWTGGRRPWRTMNGAASWETAGPDFLGAATISAFGISPTDGNDVYLGFNNGFVARSTNALSASPTWTVSSSGLLIGGWVSSVNVDPVNPEIAYCTYSNFNVPHVFRTTNGGATWASIDGFGAGALPDIPAHWIEVRPTNSNQLYLATELGVFASDDAGATWNPASPNLPTTVVESLDFKDNNTLVAFTHGRGAFLASLAGCVGDLNGDGFVGSADQALLLGQWGGSSGTGDINGDGNVGSADLAMLLGGWGACP